MLKHVMILVPFIFIGCGLFGDSKTKQPAPKNATIALEGSLGWFGDSARIRFTYPFELGKHEVTQAEFQELMGFNPIPANRQNNEDPVAFVSFFDAVLYCNRLSGIQQMDSVYSYIQAHFDSLGRAISLEGLQVNLSRNGYRLPTEAEWEFASRGTARNHFPWGSDSSNANSYAWNLENAEGVLHPVCAASTTGDGFCDLAGNAMEWVDGWYGVIPKDTLTDFAGYLHPNSSAERIVKGGCFRSSISGLSTILRRDVYPVYSHTRTDYIGFRIARGAIPSPNYQEGDSMVVPIGIPTRLTASRQEILQFFGTSNIRVVYVNAGSDALGILDYSQMNIAIEERKLPTIVRNPSISPDGNTIAYATRSEGQSGFSQSFLMPLAGNQAPTPIGFTSAYVPRWIPGISQDSSWLIYVDQAPVNRDSTEWATSSTYKLAVVNGVQATTATKIYDAGGFHDGISADGRYLATSYTDLRILDQTTGQVGTFFQFPANGKDVNASSQVCNASVKPDSSGQVLFIDFGYDKTSTIVQKPYGIHEYLFTMNPASGIVNDWIQVIPGYKSWDFPEWSNDPGFAVATVVDETDQHKAIYAIRMSDHATLKIAEGGDLWTPMLWITPFASSDYNSDSLFQYNKGIGNEIFSAKMMRFWNVRENIEAVALGSSRTNYGLNPDEITKVRVLNMAAIAGEPWLYFDIWRSYLKHLAPKLKWVILELSYDFFYYRPVDMFETMYANTQGRLYDEKQNFWRDGLPDKLSQRLASAGVPTYDDIISDNGFQNLPSNGFGTMPLVINPKTGYLDRPDYWPTSADSLEVMITEMQQAGIQVLGVLFPQNPAYTAIDLWGIYGPSLAEAAAIHQAVQGISQRHSNFRILDQHKLGQHDYGPQDGFDYDHMSYLGAEKLSRRVDSVLANW